MTLELANTRWGQDVVQGKSPSPQYLVLQTQLRRPDERSDHYLQIHDIPWHDGSVHRQISGVHVVVDRFKEPWSSLHDEAKVDGPQPKLAVTHLDIFCDTLEVVSRLSIPQAKVRIFARRLIFATPEAVLSTSANPWRLADAPAAGDSDAHGGNGLHGRAGGQFEVYIQELKAGNNSPRLLAAGCDGQNAGRGMNGAAGASVDSMSHIHEEFSANFGTQGVDFNFDPVAVFFSFRWTAAMAPSPWCGGLYSDMEYGKKDSWPSSGSDAVPAGKPGDASDGGSLQTNLPGLVALFQAPAGASGRKGEDYRGGAHGNPKVAARYHVVGKMVTGGLFSKARVHLDYENKEKREVHNGKDGPAPSANRQAGKVGSTRLIDNSNCWFSVEAVQPVLQHLRDLMISGYPDDAAQLLAVYLPVLELAGAEAGDLDVLAWAKAEAAEIQMRLRSNLDYFGHPAGYTPSYSLGATLGIHQTEIDLAMGQLLLAYRLEDSQRRAKSLGAVNDEWRELTESQMESSAASLTEADKQMQAIRDRIENELQPDLLKVQTRFDALEVKLINQARSDLSRMNEIRGGMKIAGALCQLIPVGQPILGKVGNMTALVTDTFVRPDASFGDVKNLIKPTIEILSKATDVCTLYANAASDTPKKEVDSKKKDVPADKDVRKQAPQKSLFTIKEISEPGCVIVDELSDGEFKSIARREFKKAREFVKVDAETPAKNSASKDAGKDKGGGLDWARLKNVGKGLEPLLKDFSDGVAGFKVPQSELDAYLNKLKSDNEDFKALAKEIESFNKKKAECLLKLEELGLKICACRESIIAGATLFFRLRQTAIQNGTEISPAVQSLSRVIRHRAERSLLRSLYMMVKAHESLLLQTPKGIDWRLDQLAKKALQLAGTDAATAGSFTEQTRQLTSLFRSNVTAIRDSLIQQHVPGRADSRKTKLVLTAGCERDAALFAEMNAGHKVTLDPLEYGLIKPDEHRARLAKVTLLDFAFEDASEPRGTSAGGLGGRTMDLYLEIDAEGAVRSDEHLYWLRSDRPASWSWSCWEKRNPGRGSLPWEIKASTPSIVDADVLDFLVGQPSAGETIKDRRERARSALAMPPLWSAINLWASFNDDGSNLTKPPKLTRLEFMVEYESEIADTGQATLQVRSVGAAAGALIGCTPDLGGRGDGYADHMLRIYKKAPPALAGSTPTETISLTAPERIGEMRFAGWEWRVRGQPPQKSSDNRLSLAMTGHTQVLCRWHRGEMPVQLRSTTHQALLALHASADPDAALLGVIRMDAIGAELQRRDDGWRLVQCGAQTGWIEPPL